MTDSPLLPVIQVARNSSGGIHLIQIGSDEPFDISKYEGMTFISQEEHRRAVAAASTIELTGAMIVELASLVGFSIEMENPPSEEAQFLLDDEFIIRPCPPQGVRMDDGSIQFFPLIAIAVNGDDGEVTPLGDPIPQP